MIFLGKGEGNSMQPLINQDDRVYIERVKLSQIKTGDIVVFYQNKNFIAHRVFKVKDKKIITKGDNSFFLDKEFEFSKIIGRVTMIEGKYGRIDLNNLWARIFTFYFIFYSWFSYYSHFFLQKILIKVFRGRRFLVKLLAVKPRNN